MSRVFGGCGYFFSVEKAQDMGFNKSPVCAMGTVIIWGAELDGTSTVVCLRCFFC